MAAWKHDLAQPAFDIDLARLPVTVTLAAARGPAVAGLAVGALLLAITSGLMLSEALESRPMAAIALTAGVGLVIISVELLLRRQRLAIGAHGVAMFTRAWLRGQIWRARYCEFEGVWVRELSGHHVVELRHRDPAKSVLMHRGPFADMARSRCMSVAERVGLAVVADRTPRRPTAEAAGTSLLDSLESEWNAQAPVPDGITIDNLRRRGFELLRVRITVRGARNRWALAGLGLSVAVAAAGYVLDQLPLFIVAAAPALAAALIAMRKLKPRTWTVSVLPSSLSIDDGRVRGEPSPLVFSFGDIQTIRIEPPPRDTVNALLIASSRAAVHIGRGLSPEALSWLKSYLILEASGLTWKPIFDVGRRTTRKRAESSAARPQIPARLARVYLEHAPPKMLGLGSAVKARDPVALRRDAHWLKSSSANVGATKLSELCQLMEIYALNNELSKVELLFSDINAEFTQTIGRLSTFQGSDPADAFLAAKPTAMPRHELKRHRRGPGKPALEAGGAPQDGRPSASSRFAARVLLVEDSLVNQEFAREFISELVTEFEVVDNGRQAVEAHERGRFDIILMDCQMPEMDGFEATRLIRKRENALDLAPVPIIALTANALRGDRDECLAAGMDDYISKPFAPERVREVLQKWLVDMKGPGGSVRKDPQSIAARSDAEPPAAAMHA